MLRKKPPGEVLASAHAVEREYQVLAALQRTRVPVPPALCLCTDAAVLGTPFYVMGHVQVPDRRPVHAGSQGPQWMCLVASCAGFRTGSKVATSHRTTREDQDVPCSPC